MYECVRFPINDVLGDFMDTSDMQTADIEALVPCVTKKPYEQPTGPLTLSLNETGVFVGPVFDGIGTSTIS
jgi:hypothetical protein